MEQLNVAWKIYSFMAAFAVIVLWIGKTHWSTNANCKKIKEHETKCERRQTTIHDKIEGCQTSINHVGDKVSELSGFIRGMGREK